MRESWHAATIALDRGEIETASHLLHEMGCNGIVEEPEVKGRPARLTAYFKAEQGDAAALARRIRSTFAPFPALADAPIDIVTSAANEWQEKWRQWFAPFAIVPGIIIVPSWERFEAKDGEQIIALDPGMAFGTGLHQTTRLCAREIYQRSTMDDGRPSSFVDVGTGSGLLAMIARRLLIPRIAAVENDPDALAVARENFEKNGIADIATAGDIGKIDGTFDLVVANILLLTLIELKDDLIARMAPGGKLILSGITRDQEERIHAAFAPPLALEGIARQDEWSCMTFLCPNSL